MPPSDWGVADSLQNPVFDLLLLRVGEACDEIDPHLVIVPGRNSNGGVKTALVDGFIFGRSEHLAFGYMSGLPDETRRGRFRSVRSRAQFSGPPGQQY
jgi:hypothetical protein